MYVFLFSLSFFFPIKKAVLREKVRREKKKSAPGKKFKMRGELERDGGKKSMFGMCLYVWKGMDSKRGLLFSPPSRFFDREDCMEGEV